MSPERIKRPAERTIQIAALVVGLGVSAGMGYLVCERTIKGLYQPIATAVKQHYLPTDLSRLEPPRTITLGKDSR